jgi:inner membrane protein involved in colicin E2 resistance
MRSQRNSLNWKFTPSNSEALSKTPTKSRQEEVSRIYNNLSQGPSASQGALTGEMLVCSYQTKQEESHPTKKTHTRTYRRLRNYLNSFLAVQSKLSPIAKT